MIIDDKGAEGLVGWTQGHMYGHGHVRCCIKEWWGKKREEFCM